MMINSEFRSIAFDLPKNQSNVIKVVGVGGGGSNAINHMFKQGIKGVDFIICNTDSQALDNSAVPYKIQLGVNLTEGLGAGANPDVGQQAALESIDDIEKMLDGTTKLVFITAGMGGGTGTGAAPVIAQLAREKGILTVGIVTSPFLFEGKIRQEQASLGIEKLRKQVDSLIVINNNKLREVYGNLGFKAGFSKSDEVLATASRGIAEVITHHYTQNIDLRDAKTVLANSGTAIMGSATAKGENRAKDAIVSALDSPLLNDNKITGAKNVLLLIVSGSDEITIDEISEINEFIQFEAGNNANIIMGVGEDESLGSSISVTIIATGFNVEQQNEIVNTEPIKIIHTLESEQKVVQDLTQKSIPAFNFNNQSPVANSGERVVFELLEDIIPPKEMVSINKEELVVMSEFIKNLNVSFEIVSPINDIGFTVESPKFFEDTNLNTPKYGTEKDQQTTFSFDLPLPNQNVGANKIDQNNGFFELSDETREIRVNEAIQFVPVTELSEDGIVRHTLEEYSSLENKLLNSKASQNVVEELIPVELNITMKKVDAVENVASSFGNISPTEMTIQETLMFKADERKKKLKEFNYKFHSNVARTDDLEKEPAYKRSGINLSNPFSNNANSRISVATDSNDDLQLRFNNSYLHDNVD